MASERLSFSYPLHMKEDVKRAADKECRSVSAMIQLFIKEGLEKRGFGEEVKPKKKRKRIRRKAA